MYIFPLTLNDVPKYLPFNCKFYQDIQKYSETTSK